MTVTTEENYAADEFFAAEDPPGTDGQGETPGEEAPYGWTRDRQTGVLRPKKRPGRPKVPPGPDELAAAPEVERSPDRPPSGKKPPGAEVPMPKGGIIAKGVNRLYRKAGKIIRTMDEDLGEAIIECTRAEDADDLTVGEAWENLCKANPRVRAFVLGCLKGGAWGDLLMAHLPIGLALLMKPWVRRFLPFQRLVESVAEPDEDTPPGEGGLPGGMTAEDVTDMEGVMSAQAERMAQRAAGRMGVDLSPEDIAEARRLAGQMMDGNIPPGLRRTQPQRRSRAARRK